MSKILRFIANTFCTPPRRGLDFLVDEPALPADQIPHSDDAYDYDACTCGSTCRPVPIHEFGTYGGDEQNEMVSKAISDATGLRGGVWADVSDVADEGSLADIVLRALRGGA